MTVKIFPKLYLTLREMEALPEYSASYPTGTTPGKRWKRQDGAFDERFIARGGKPKWFILEYYDSPEIPPDRIGIRWYIPVIKVKAISVKN